MLKKTKVMAVLLAAVSTTQLLTGCSILKNQPNKQTEDWKISTCDSSKLYSGQYYVWHDENQSNIERDINTDVSKFKDYTYDIFTPVYKELSPASSAAEENALRVLWMTDENDGKIPTLYKGDKLIYYSTTKVPSEFKLERFYDHGYSIGVYGLHENIEGSGQYVLDLNGTMGVKKNTTAAKMSKYITKDTPIVSIAQVGDVEISSKNISKSGTIKGLIHGQSYDVSVYNGTVRHLIRMTADTRIFSSMELYTLTNNAYNFVGNGVITINLPENLKSGYYYINNTGLFRYIDGTEYDGNTNFNDPGVIRDDTGKIIYDPRTTKTKTAKYSNKDSINDSNVSDSSKKSVSVKTESVNVNVKLGDIINKSVVQTPTISYYRVSDSADNTDTKEEGSKSNPYIIKATAEELANGEINRTISNLPSGVWMFVVNDVGNYSTHTLTVKLIVNTSNIGMTGNAGN